MRITRLYPLLALSFAACSTTTPDRPDVSGGEPISSTSSRIFGEPVRLDEPATPPTANRTVSLEELTEAAPPPAPPTPSAPSAELDPDDDSQIQWFGRSNRKNENAIPTGPYKSPYQ